MALEQAMMQNQPPMPAGPQAGPAPGAAPEMEEGGEQEAIPLTDDEEQDLKIGVMLAQNLLDKGGADTLLKAIDGSKDPGTLAGQFLLQMGQQMMENMPEDAQLSPKILLTEGGWLEQISDYLQEQYEVPKKVMDAAEIYVASTAQQMAQNKQQQSPDGQSIGGIPAPPVPGPGSPAPVPQGGA